MPAAQYLALLARALPGTSYHALTWHISLALGWSLIHASGILHGEVFIWPDASESKVGRLFLRVQSMRKEGYRDLPGVDL